MLSRSPFDEVKRLIKDKNFDAAIQQLLALKAELISDARSLVDINEKKKLIDTIKTVDKLIIKVESKIERSQENFSISDSTSETQHIEKSKSTKPKNNLLTVLQPLAKKVRTEIMIPLFYKQNINNMGVFIFGKDASIVLDVITELKNDVDFNLEVIDSSQSNTQLPKFKKQLFNNFKSNKSKHLIVFKVIEDDFEHMNVASLMQQLSVTNYDSTNPVRPIVIYTSSNWKTEWASQLLGLTLMMIDVPSYEERLVVAYRGLEHLQANQEIFDQFSMATSNYSYLEILGLVNSFDSIHQLDNTTILTDMIQEIPAKLDSIVEDFRVVFESIQLTLEALIHTASNEEEDDRFQSSDLEPSLVSSTPVENSLVSHEANSTKQLNNDIQSTQSSESVEVEDHETKIERIISAFDEYNIKHGDITYVEGSTFSRYRVPLARGEKISSVTKVINEIKMRLKSSNVRIIAPIENDDAIGIELPNSVRKVVSYQNISKNYKGLKIPIGLEVDNQTIFLDFKNDPHYIIAGSTGSGKSVNLNVIIAYLLMHKSPEEVSLLLIDPKQVEFNNLANLPHSITPRPLNTIEEILQGLEILIQIMHDRNKIITQAGCRNIHEFNESNPPMAFIVGIIDEFATISDDDEIMNAVQKISQLSRSAGIHLILATQRPSADIVNGTIKNNFTGRIAFKVASNHDSRTIIFESGAEELMGQGDMLVANSGTTLKRAQGAYISLMELNQIMYATRLKYTTRNKIFYNIGGR